MRKVLIAFLYGALVAQAGDVVLYDAASASQASVGEFGKSSFTINNGVLEIFTKGGSGSPGVTIHGEWDMSSSGKLLVEMVNRDCKGPLPITAGLSIAGGEKKTEVYLDRVYISGKVPQEYSFPVPVFCPHVDEISEKLFGMRTPPVMVCRPAVSKKLEKVTEISLYIQKPKLDWKWGIRRIILTNHDAPPRPLWADMTAGEFFPFIDKYGQYKYKDWPGKIHSDADLAAAREAEKVDLAAHPGPEGWSRFGGWKKGPKLRATGHFRVEKVDGKWWMVDPEGYLYWSHGPVRVTPSTAITPLDKRDFYFTDLPAPDSPFALFYTTRDELLYPYYVKRNIQRTYDFSSANVYRKYGKGWFETYADLAHRRLRSWGCNTIANSSDKRICLMDRTPYTDRFELKSRPIQGCKDGMWWPFRDPFDVSFRADVRRNMIEHKAEMEDPWCFGFFVDNELSWGGETDLAGRTLQSPADQPAKVEFMKWLKKKYDSISALNATWGTAYTDWPAFLTLTEWPKGNGAQPDLKAFTLVIADAYFKNVREEFKRFAPDKLYMGCRYAGNGSAHAVRASAPYCDIISFNIYARTIQNLRLPEGIDKPVIIGEFHFGALDRGMFHPGLVRLKNQEERGQVYTQYVTSALKNPQVVGVHWHQFGDQATTGRFDGENFQVGFVDCCDTPYPETVSGIRKVGYKLYEIREGK